MEMGREGGKKDEKEVREKKEEGWEEGKNREKEQKKRGRKGKKEKNKVSEKRLRKHFYISFLFEPAQLSTSIRIWWKTNSIKDF